MPKNSEETTVTIRMPKALKQRAQHMAEKKDLTLSQYIRRAITNLSDKPVETLT